MGHLRDLPFVESDPGRVTRRDLRRRSESRELAGLDARADAPEDADRPQAPESGTHVVPGAAQEIPPGAEDLVTWDVSPDDAGHLVEEIEAEDEADVPATMAEQGRNDADQDLRRVNRARKR